MRHRGGKEKGTANPAALPRSSFWWKKWEIKKNRKGLRVLKLSQWQRGLKLNSLAPQRERKSGNKQDMGKETRQALTSCRSAGLWHHTTPKATRQPLPRAPVAQFYGRAAAVTALSPQGWLFCLSPPSLLPTPSRGGRALRPPSASPRPRHSPTELRGAPQNPPHADPPAGARAVRLPGPAPQGLTEQGGLTSCSGPRTGALQAPRERKSTNLLTNLLRGEKKHK